MTTCSIDAVGASLPLEIATANPVTFARAPWLRHLIGNLLVASTFFAAALPGAQRFHYAPAETIWIAGSIVMGVLSLVRFAPRAAMMDARAFVSNIGVLAIPCLVRPAAASVGVLASLAIAMEIGGVALSQVARVYMGRSFGILPGNRGIVSKGPFRIVRHPIYLGWVLLTLGYLLAYPSWINFAIVLATFPFMMWRIVLEEELLSEDPEYRDYLARVHFRMLPWLY